MLIVSRKDTSITTSKSCAANSSKNITDNSGPLNSRQITIKHTLGQKFMVSTLGKF